MTTFTNDLQTIRDAYTRLAGCPGQTMWISDLRDAVGVTMTRERFDDTLLTLAASDEFAIYEHDANAIYRDDFYGLNHNGRIMTLCHKVVACHELV